MIEWVTAHSWGGRARSRDFVKRRAKANSSRMSVGTFARRLTDDPMTSCSGGSCRSSPLPRRDRRRMIRRLSFFYLRTSLSRRADILLYISLSLFVVRCKLASKKAILGMLSSRHGPILILMEWSWKNDGPWGIWGIFIVKLFCGFIWDESSGVQQAGIVYGAMRELTYFCTWVLENRK